jgi:hypothetical protein
MTKGPKATDVGSPWVRLTQGVTVLNPNYREVTPNSTDEPLLKTLPTSILFSTNKGNLVSFSERYIPGDDGSAEHTVILKILDPDDQFARSFIENTYIKLFESFVSKAINLADFSFLASSRGNAIDDIFDLYYEDEEYDPTPEIFAEGIDTDFFSNVEPVSRPQIEAEQRRRRGEFRRRAIERNTPGILDRIEKGDFSFGGVNSLLERDLKGLDGKDVAAKLTALAVSNKKINLSFGFGTDSSQTNTAREFVLKNYYSIQDSSQQGLVVIELCSPQDFQEVLTRESPMSRKSPSDEEPQHSVQVALAQMKRNTEIDMASTFVFNENGITIPEAGIFQYLQFKDTGSGVIFNNIRYITNLIEKLLTRYLVKNVSDGGGFKPVVMLNPTFSDAIANKIDQELAQYDSNGNEIPGVKSAYTKRLQRDILSIEAIRPTLAAAGIGMSYEIIPAVEEGDNTEQLTIYLEYNAVPLKDGKNISEKQVLSTIRRLYDKVGLNARMFNSSDGEVFTLNRRGFKERFFNRLLVPDGEGSNTYNIPMVSKAFVSEEAFIQETEEISQLGQSIDDFVQWTGGVGDSIINGIIDFGINSYSNETLRGIIGIDEDDALTLVRGLSMSREVLNGNYYPSIGDPYRLTVEGLYERSTNTLYGDVRIYSDDEVITSLVCPLTPNLQEKVIKQYEKRVRQATRVSNSIGASLSQAIVNREGVESFGDYVKSVQEYYSERGVVNPDVSIPPDAFAYNVERLPDIVSQALENTPIFLANVKGANVHQVTSKTTGQSFSFLQGNTIFSFFQDNGYKTLEQFFDDRDRNISKIPTSFLQGIETAALLESLRSSFTGNNSMLSLVDTLYQTYSDISQQEKALQKELTADPFFGDEMGYDLEDIRETNIVLRRPRRLLDIFLKNINNAVKNSTSDRKLSRNGIIAYFSYLQRLANSVKRLSIKTTPRFKLTQEYISKPCLFLNYNSFYAYLSNRINKKGYLSGVYQIFGYEHTISQNECSSTFYLQRHQLANDAVDSIIRGDT